MAKRPDDDLVRLIPGLDVPKAKRYSRAKLAMLLVSTLWSATRLAWFGRGRSAALRDRVARQAPSPRLVDPLFIAVSLLLGWLTSLPLAFLGGHALERRFGLTKQSAGGWAVDQAKGLGVELAIGVPLASGAYAVIRRRPRDWWLVLSALAVPFTVVFSLLAPTVLMPLFNRFEPIDDPDLKHRVDGLAQRAGVKVRGAYTMDMSRQTDKPNAFFTGIGRTKRVVLSDTLLDRFAPAEVDGVVAHELGHQANGDIWRMMAVGSGIGFGSAWLTQRIGTRLVRRNSATSGVAAVGDVASLPMLGLAGMLVGFATAPLTAAYSRRIERRTDRFALELTGDGASYASAMGRLASLSLADPDPPRPVVVFLYSHPPIAERIRAALAFGNRGR